MAHFKVNAFNGISKDNNHYVDDDDGDIKINKSRRFVVSEKLTFVQKIQQQQKKINVKTRKKTH